MYLQNICAQAYRDNTPPRREMIDCPGMKWCSNDEGITFHRCEFAESQNPGPFHKKLHMNIEIGSTTVSSTRTRDHQAKAA